MAVIEKFRKTEIGNLPSDWEVKAINQIADVKSGKRLPIGKNLIKETTPHPYIRVTDMCQGSVSLENIMYVPEEVFLAIKNYRIYKEDIFISVAGTLGIVGKIPTVLNGANLTENANRLCNIKCDRDYLLFTLMSPIIQTKIESEKTLGAQPKLALTRIRKFKIPVPPTKTEQTAIAIALSDTDALITSLEKLIAKKRNIKHGAMQMLFKPKKGWENKQLSDLSKIIRGASPRPIDSPIWFDKNSEVGWVRISDVTKSFKYLKSTTQKLSGLGVKHSRYVEKENLIMSICATVGRPIITKLNVCIHDGFVVFENPAINMEYLYYYLTFIEANWAKHGQTGSQMNLNTSIIKSTKIPFPLSKEEQSQIADVLKSMDNEIDVLEGKLDKTVKMKLGMMQTLLTGKIRLV